MFVWEAIFLSRAARPNLSERGRRAIGQFEQYLREEEDLSAPTLRNYLSDLQQFIAWCESTWEEGQEGERPFDPAAVATPAITRYRAYLQTVVHLKPATINRYLISLKRYFAWAADAGLIQRNPAKVVKLMEQEEQPPRHLTDQEENNLVAAVNGDGDLRDRTIVTLMLHTGLRAQEVCRLKREHVQKGKRSGVVRIYGKRNKWLSSRTLRQEVHSETNKSETIHAFYDFLTFGGDKIKQAEREEQDKSDKYEQLVGNLVSLYNTVHMTAILDELAREGIKYTDEDLTFLSPLITEHINRFGKYRVNLAKQPKITDLDALHTGFLSHHQPPNKDLPN
jgi:site-specific recombinase XerC